MWLQPVYQCKLCGEKIIDRRQTEAITEEDLESSKYLPDYITKENIKLHTSIDKSNCMGFISCIGFVDLD